MKKKTISVRVSEGTLKQLRDLKRIWGEEFSDVVRKSIDRTWLEQMKIERERLRAQKNEV